ncbi:MAG: hypothetical protein H0T52_15730 [Lautropia sp.]|nr:hypothetical protein [Lautropia sp.]
MSEFTKVELYTAEDGRARFREVAVPLNQGTAAAMLSGILPASGIQFRQSPVGFTSVFHCTTTPQWLFVLSGTMEIGLQDGAMRRFGAGEHFLSADTLPEGATFDPRLHGHRSAQVGDGPLVTLFVKV